MSIEKTKYKLEEKETMEDAWNNFIEWEQKSRDTITVKKVYIDIVRDLIAGILLHQLIYWHLPSKKADTKLCVQKNGEYWLAKLRSDWWDEIRITERQYDRAINILKDMYIIETQLFKFNGLPTIHIKINKDVLLGLLNGDKPRSRRKDKQNKDNQDKENQDSQRGKRESHKGQNGNYTKCKTGITQSVIPLYKQRLPAETTEQILSKESICNSQGVAECEPRNEIQQTNNELNGNTSGSLTDSPRRIKKINNDAVPQSTQLRNQTVKSKPKKTFAECPVEFEPYLEIWESYTGRVFRGMTETYEKAWKTIQKIVRGKFFNKKRTPSVDPSWHGYKLTIEDYKLSLKNFSIMRNNADYYPKSKKNIEAISLKTFFYNPFSPGDNTKSYFISCLEGKPRLLAPQLNDPNPIGTDYVIEACKEKFSWDLSNGGRPTAIKCVARLSKFYEENKHRIIQYDYFYGTIYKQVDELLEMLDRNQSYDYPAQPMYLHGDLTYNKLLPEHLKYVGSLEN